MGNWDRGVVQKKQTKLWYENYFSTNIRPIILTHWGWSSRRETERKKIGEVSGRRETEIVAPRISGGGGARMGPLEINLDGL